LLRAAFRDYGRALRAADGKTQAELVLLANLRISLHEQTRLQPEIAPALNAPASGGRFVEPKSGASEDEG
jgi:hypothetical protein